MKGRMNFCRLHGIFKQKPALGFLPGAVAEKVAVLEWWKDRVFASIGKEGFKI
jgi:hypothetical protein